MGKSSLVCNIAEAVATGKNSKKQSMPVAFFSLEMSQTELAHRFIASQARIHGDRLRKGKVAEKDWPRVLRACNDLEQSPLWIDDSADLGMLDLRAKARRLHAQEKSKGNGGLGLIIVDYLQLMRPDNLRMNRVEQVGQMSRGLKLLAKELNIPVIGLSQLSRRPEERPDKRPILSDLRESGNIEQDADLVAFIYRDDVYRNKEEDEFGDNSADDGIAELLIRKHRNGPIDTIKLVFRAEYPKFLSYSGGQQPIEQRPGEEPIEELAGSG
jgi:replicative DNA helicase